jgi:hypothetical protein
MYMVHALIIKAYTVLDSLPGIYTRTQLHGMPDNTTWELHQQGMSNPKDRGSYGMSIIVMRNCCLVRLSGASRLDSFDFGVGRVSLRIFYSKFFNIVGKSNQVHT